MIVNFYDSEFLWPHYMVVSIAMRVPKNAWFMMENQIKKWMIFFGGSPMTQETSLYGISLNMENF